MATTKATVCAQCGQRITTVAYPYKGNHYCRKCFEQLTANLQSAEDARAVLHKEICNVFNLPEISADVTHIIDRELGKGRTINGLIKALYYYTRVLGNPTPEQANSLSWIWANYYEASKNYYLKLKKITDQNAKVGPDPEPILVPVTRDSLAPIRKQDFGYNFEDL